MKCNGTTSISTANTELHFLHSDLTDSTSNCFSLKEQWGWRDISLVCKYVYVDPLFKFNINVLHCFTEQVLHVGRRKNESLQSFLSMNFNFYQNLSQELYNLDVSKLVVLCIVAVFPSFRVCSSSHIRFIYFNSLTLTFVALRRSATVKAILFIRTNTFMKSNCTRKVEDTASYF